MQDLTITQGDEKAYNLHFTGGGEDINITGATVTMTIKRGRNDADPVLTKTVSAHTNASEGKTTITLTEANTGIDLGDYFYDIQISGGGIAKKTVLKGKLTITWQATED